MYTFAKHLVAENVRLLAVAAIALVALGNVLFLYRPVESVSAGVVVWWSVLCAVSVGNVCGWRLSAAALARRRDVAHPEDYLFQRRQLILSAVYVLGCAFRSVLPRADVQRFGLLDSWVSSVLVGRSVATVAELCFVAQWALLLHRMARDADDRFAAVLARLLVPLIAVAELCSWYAVLTTCYLGNAVEESIWAFTAALVLVGLVRLWPRCGAACRPFLLAAMALGVAFVAYMVSVDVPMYVSRWLADEAGGRAYLSLGQGLQDVCSRRVVTFAWQEWREEVPWMSLYFSVGVWCSIALVHVPRWHPRRTAGCRAACG
jgi:hypothetical protein